MKSSRWVAAVVIGVAGCGADSDPVADPTSYSIAARDVVTLRALDGATLDSPVDLDPAVVQAYARAQDGAWTAYAGEGTSAGELAVASVPAGPAWLRVDYFDASPEAPPRNELFRVDAQADTMLDLGTWRTGRTGIAYPTVAPTQVSLDMSGLAPWQPGLDLAIVYAANIGFVQVFSQDAEGIEGLPASGETASLLTADWAGAVGGPLIDAAAGDRAVAMQLRFRLMNGVYVGAPVKSAELPAFSIADGGQTSVTAAFSAPAPFGVRVAMDRPAFDAFGLGPAFGRGFAISAAPTPVHEDFSLSTIPAELVVVDSDLTGSGLLDLGDVDVVSPFPRDRVFGHFISGYYAHITRDDGLEGNAMLEIGELTDVLPTAAAPARPIIGPVSNIVVGDGLTPTITWTAPALGTATEYEVRILAAGGFDPRYDFLYYPAAIFHVPGDQTELALPPEVLVPDLPYLVSIRAITNALPADQRAAAPRRIALPYGWADAISTSFKR